MQLRVGAVSAAYKLTTDAEGAYDADAVFGEAKQEVHLACARNDRAVFQVLLSADEAFAVNVTEQPWFSTLAMRRTLRVAGDFPFTAEFHHVGLFADNDRMRRADVLLNDAVCEYAANAAAAVCIGITVPKKTQPGPYTGVLRVFSCSEFFDEVCEAEIPVSLTVYDVTLADLGHGGIHLDLWQHVSNVARHAEVPLFSDAHFAVLEDYCRALGEVGVNAVSVMVSEIPWSGQGCCDKPKEKGNLFEYSMVRVTKHADGRFTYDYSAMKRYIDLFSKYCHCEVISVFGALCNFAFMPYAEKKLIADYPGVMYIRYFDETAGLYRYMRTTEEIDDYFRALERYFIDTAQIDRVRITSDEPADNALFGRALAHMHEIAPHFRYKIATDHPELLDAHAALVKCFVPDIETLTGQYARIREYHRSYPDTLFLYYVCCGPAYPNDFLCSPLVESYYLGILGAYTGMDGFLRWDFSVWNDTPRTEICIPGQKAIPEGDIWAAGDTHFIYPAHNGTMLRTLRLWAMERGMRFWMLLRQMQERGMEDALRKAYAMVMRTYDMPGLLATKREQAYSLSPEDYDAMWEFLLSTLGADA